MKSIIVTLFLFTIIAAFSVNSVFAWADDENQIPNGGVFGCNTCHGATTHTLNPFGNAYSAASDTWTEALASADSDGDGYTNGEELLDPDGIWVEGQANPGDPVDVTNPGNASSHPSGPTPTPTQTPNATNTPPVTQTPQPTATPGDCSQTGVKIIMPDTSYSPDDTFFCNIDICNQEGQTLSGYPLIVLLDVYGSYFFAPSFSSELEFYSIDIAVGASTVVVIPEFIWPSGTGSASGIIWYAAITDPSISSIIGIMDSVSFGWTE